MSRQRRRRACSQPPLPRRQPPLHAFGPAPTRRFRPPPPNRCSFDFEIRYLPEDDENAIVARIKAAAEKIAEGYRGVFAEARFTVQDLQSYPAMNTPVDSEAVKFIHALTGGNSTGNSSAIGVSAAPRSTPSEPWPREMPSSAARAMRSQ